MRRREFAAGAGTLIGAACAPNVSAADDTTAIKQAIADVYATFYSGLDKQKYRALLTADYVLLEQGKLLDIEGDLALMPTPGLRGLLPEVDDKGYEGDSQPKVAGERDLAEIRLSVAHGTAPFDQDHGFWGVIALFVASQPA